MPVLACYGTSLRYNILKNENSVDTLVLLTRGNKIPMGGDTETKCVADTEERPNRDLIDFN
jgi:hypothetical protein